MKKTLMVSLLLLGAVSIHAQSTDRPAKTNNAVCKSFPDMPANARPVWPKSEYTPLQDPSCAPCYEYTSKRGTVRMECPYLQFPPEHNTSTLIDETPVTVARPKADRAIILQSENTYTGNYPKVCKRSPDMPANAKPVWPKTAYTPLQDPTCPPCYEYRSKKGTLRMECPYLRFPPEHKE